MTISSFDGEYQFLSNFFPVTVFLDGECYPSVEHAYQAAKTTNPYERQFIKDMKTPGRAKRAGRHLMLREDWELIKISVMHDLLRQKFSHETLRKRLLATGDEKLEEGNTWKDYFWGVCNGIGQNQLGVLLMRVREEIRHCEKT
ncbi:MAG: NADAR family protein [bacterium]